MSVLLSYGLSDDELVEAHQIAKKWVERAYQETCAEADLLNSLDEKQAGQLLSGKMQEDFRERLCSTLI